MVMKGFITIITVLLVAISPFCQNIEEDIMAMGQVMIAPNGFGAKIKTTVYGVDNNPLVQKGLLFRCKGNKSFCEIDSISILKNGIQNIVIDKTNRIIKQFQQQEEQVTDFATQLKESIANLDSIAFKGIVNGQKHYEILLKDETYAKAELFIDTRTKVYSKIIYFHNTDKPQISGYKTIIEMTDVSLSIDDNLFEEKQFITRTPSRVVPAPRFEGFDIQ
jgi:hypothetical protein